MCGVWWLILRILLEVVFIIDYEKLCESQVRLA